MLPLWATMALECGCLTLFAIEMGLKAMYMGSAAFFSSRWHLAQLLILATDAAGVLMSAASPATLTFFNPLLRPLLFVAMSRTLRRAASQFLSVIPAVADCLILIVLLLVVASIGGVLLFEHCGPPYYFDSLPNAALNLFILTTTANYPDVMLPAYAEYCGGAALFFVAFLLLGLFVLMNLVLAAVFAAHKQRVGATAAHVAANRTRALAASFRLLDLNGNGYVELPHLSMLLQRIDSPLFSLFSGEAHDPLDTALTRAKINALLQLDPSVNVRGLRPAAFASCLLALQESSGRAAAAAPADGAADGGDTTPTRLRVRGGGGCGGGAATPFFIRGGRRWPWTRCCSSTLRRWSPRSSCWPARISGL